MNTMNFKPDILLTTCMKDPQLFGNVFGYSSFWTWMTIAKLIDGIALTEEREIELFEQCTGRKYKLLNGVAPMFRCIIIEAGRRAGKDRFFSGVVVWRAALCTDWRKFQSAGEGAVCILLGADKKQAQILRKYCDGLLQAPLLAREVVRTTGDIIEFRNGGSLEIATNDARLVRGRSAIAVVGSECCHWKTGEYAASSDEEVVSAAEKSMAMTVDGGLLLLGSSVHLKKGYMYREYLRLFGNDEAEDLVWFAPSQVMNPRLKQSTIDKAIAKDGPRARADYLNVWRELSEEFIPPVVIEKATDFGTYEREPRLGVSYTASTDPAEGTGKDSYAFAISHRDAQTNTTIIDCIREFRPPFVPSAVVAELAKVLKRYHISEVYADRHAAGFHADLWNQNGVSLRIHKYNTSENYLTALSHLLSGHVRLIDSDTARSQFIGLERRDDKVDHAQHANAHDDVSCACAGAIVAANLAGAAYWESGLFQQDTPTKSREQEAADYQHSRLQQRLFEISGRTLWPY